MPHQPKLACNSGARPFRSTRKHCNPNDSMSTFEIRVGESHATFLRNHNVRHYKGPQRHHTGPQAEDNSSPEEPHNPDSRQNRQQHGGTALDQGHCTRSGALHPIRGTAPEQKRCIAYGSGAPPQHTRTNAKLTEPLRSPPQPAQAKGSGRICCVPWTLPHREGRAGRT